MQHIEYTCHSLGSNHDVSVLLPADYKHVKLSRVQERSPQARMVVVDVVVPPHSGQQVEVIDCRGPDIDDNPAELLRILSVLGINRRLEERRDVFPLLRKVALLPTPEAGRIHFLTQKLDATFDDFLRNPQRLSTEHIRYFMYQLLRALKYLHSANVVLGHVSPASCFFITASENACLSPTQAVTMKGTVVSRDGLPPSNAYLAPEQLAEAESGLVTATMEGDSWGFGCVAAELAMRRPLFGGGSLQSAREGMSSFFGSVSAEPDRGAADTHRAIQDLLQRPTSAHSALSNDSQFVDFLSHCLQPNPQHRWSAEQLLAHPFHNDTREGIACEEPSARQPVSWSVPQQGVHESKEVFVDQLHGMILLEMIAMNPEEVYWLEGE